MNTSLVPAMCQRKMVVRAGEYVRPASRWRHFLPLLPLAVSDLLVGLCDVASILFAPASIISIINCSILVFSAATTRVLLKTRYSWQQTCGIGVAAVGVLLVGGSASLGRGGHSNSSAVAVSSAAVVSVGLSVGSRAPVGVLLALSARMLQSVQFAFEERYMKGGRFSPMLQVGAEGVIESSLCAAIVLPLVSLLPGSDHDHVEDLWSTLQLLRSSSLLCWLCALLLTYLLRLGRSDRWHIANRRCIVGLRTADKQHGGDQDRKALGSHGNSLHCGICVILINQYR